MDPSKQRAFVKQIREAWHGLVKQMPHLHHESRTLLDQVVAMTRDGL